MKSGPCFVSIWVVREFYLYAGFGSATSGVSFLATGTDILNRTTAVIHSDFGTGLIYNNSGKVADPVTRAIVRDFHASSPAAPDSALISFSSWARPRHK